MKKNSYLLLFLLVFGLFVTEVFAITIRETMDENDGYTTLEEGSIIIGVTRFSPKTIVTASRAATAGVNDVMLYMNKNGNTNGYEMPGVYYYVDPYVGWFFLDSNNNATPVVNNKELEKLSKLDIYYVDNVEKVLGIDFPGENVNVSTLPDGVIFEDNKLYVNATIQSIEFKTNDNKTVSFKFDPITSKFIEDTKTCYVVSNGIITSYDSSCGSDVVIPLEFNGEKITGIGVDAFRNTNLTSVIIPSEIVSIGSNAFADNELESVIIKDKYDESDFSFYGDNVFGNFLNIVYDNELTRMLSYVDSNYVVKYYKDVNIDTLINNPSNEYGLRDYVSLNLIETLKDNGYDKDYNYCYNGCNYEEDYINGNKETLEDLYGLSLLYVEDYKYTFLLEKYDFDSKKVYLVTKIVNVSFEESGIKENANIVKDAVNNLQIDTRFEDMFNNDIVTRLKYIYDLEDIYDIDIVLTSLGDDIEIGDYREVLYYGSSKNSYYLKDGVIYDVLPNVMLLGYENQYVSYFDNSNYDNVEDYIEIMLNEFSNDTGVNNYFIYYNQDGKAYTKAEQSHKVGTDYEIELIDIDYSEKWVIKFIDYNKDLYDDNGYTMASCFGFNNGVITSYNGMCGANVKIPNQINGIDVISIANDENYSELFYNSGIISILLPNTLNKIGVSVFENNRFENLVIPYGILEIGDNAFANLIVKGYVSIPKSVNKLGKNIFSNLKSNNNDDFIYARLEDGLIDKTILMAYGGKVDNDSNIILTLPEGIVEIRENVFSYNYNLDGIILPNTLEKIGNNAFYNTLINDFVIPSGVKSIGNNVFNISNGILKIFISDKSSERDFDYLGNNAFGNANEIIYENRVEISELILNKRELDLFIGDVDTLIVTINPSNATDRDIVWTSSNDLVVTVNNGLLEAVGEGSAIITATVGGKSITCNVIVNKKITYTYEFEKIEGSIADEYYLYIVSSEGNKVSGKVNITYINDKDKEHDITENGIKIVKNAVSSIEILSIND